MALTSFNQPQALVLGFVLRQRDPLWGRRGGGRPVLCPLCMSVSLSVVCALPVSPEYETQPRQLAKNLPT